MAMTAPAPVAGFDTLSYARRLKAAGVDEAQDVSTKTDLDGLETRIDKRFSDFEVRIVRLVFAVAAGQAALIVALLKLLP